MTRRGPASDAGLDAVFRTGLSKHDYFVAASGGDPGSGLPETWWDNQSWQTPISGYPTTVAYDASTGWGPPMAYDASTGWGPPMAYDASTGWGPPMAPSLVTGLVARP